MTIFEKIKMGEKEKMPDKKENDRPVLAFAPIGVIRSPFRDLRDMPIQPAGAAGVRGEVIVDPPYQEGLRDLDGFSHLFLIYLFHRVERWKPLVVPFLDSQPRGIFATRAPVRPNPIGLSVVELLRVKDNVLIVQNVDILDGTPLLDIKPYFPEFDHYVTKKNGWLESRKGHVKNRRSDGRF